MSDGKVFVNFARGHAHYWCSLQCEADDCEFGPCCDVYREFDKNGERVARLTGGET